MQVSKYKAWTESYRRDSRAAPAGQSWAVWEDRRESRSRGPFPVAVSSRPPGVSSPPGSEGACCTGVRVTWMWLSTGRTQDVGDRCRVSVSHGADFTWAQGPWSTPRERTPSARGCARASHRGTATAAERFYGALCSLLHGYTFLTFSPNFYVLIRISISKCSFQRKAARTAV